MSDLLSAPFMYWVGMNTAPDTTAADLADFNHFYSTVHAPEVLAANPGFVAAARYELLAPDPRGDFGPRWLAAYGIADEAGALGYAARNDGPPEGRPTYTAGPSAWRQTDTRWRMIWRQVATRGEDKEPPHSIFIVGMNVPADTDAAALAAFNAFYTDIHVPEVMALGGYQRGVRYERFRAFRHPDPGCPQFCAIYTADAATTAANAERRANPNPPSGMLSSGPPAWEAHDTLWRLVYQHID